MMSTKKTYFLCSVLLLLIAITLFLFWGLRVKREDIQIGDRIFLVRGLTLLLAASILPIVIALSVALGGIGCIQGWVAFPEILKRILAYIFAAGIMLSGVAGYIRQSASGDDSYHVFQETRWMGFGGTISLALPILFHLYGVGRYSFRQGDWRRMLHPRGSTGEKEMKAAKLYALGGLLLILWALLRAFWSGWPWQEERAIGMTAVAAGIFTWPLAAALGAAALFLSVLQSLVAIHERIRVVGGITYFFGAGLFLGSLQFDLLRERAWEIPIRWSTATGLAVLLGVLLLNFVGMLRNQEKPARDVPLVTD